MDCQQNFSRFWLKTNQAISLFSIMILFNPDNPFIIGEHDTPFSHELFFNTTSRDLCMPQRVRLGLSKRKNANSLHPYSKAKQLFSDWNWKVIGCLVIEAKSWLVARWIRNKLIGCFWLRMKSDWSIKMSQISRSEYYGDKERFLQCRDIPRLPLTRTEVSFSKVWKRRPRNILRYICSSIFDFEVTPF